MKRATTMRTKTILPILLLAAALVWIGSAVAQGFLQDLAKPQDGRSMRATSTMRVGEVRRGPQGDRNLYFRIFPIGGRTSQL